MNNLFLFKTGISLGASGQYDQKCLGSCDASGGGAPHQCNLSVGLRYAPASSEAALMRESNGICAVTLEFQF
jgi:hypothetical protein